MSTEVVSVLTTFVGTTQAREDIFLCTDGEAPAQVTTSAYPIGGITLSISLLNASGQAVGQSNGTGSTITAGNELVEVGPVTITRF